MAPLGPPDERPPSGEPPRDLPERMKANRALAGAVCPGCAKTVALGDDLWNCRACSTPHHAACRASAGTCCAAACTAQEERESAAGGETKKCPYCGEEILKAAKKCKHCKEILSPSLRRARERGSAKDENLGRDAMIMALVGLFLCPPILGPLAIVKASKALKQGQQTTMAGVGMAFGILDSLLFVLYIVGALVGK